MKLLPVTNYYINKIGNSLIINKENLKNRKNQ